MANSFLENGCISDLLAYIKDDLVDTYDHQSEFLGALVDSEINQTACSGRFSLNGYQYYLEHEAGSNIYNVYTSDSNKTLVQTIDTNSMENTGLWASLDDLENDIQSSADATYTMLAAANVADSDDESSALSKFASSCSCWIGNASAAAKDTYSNIIDSLACGSDSKFTIVSWLINQYKSVSDSSGNDSTGAITFADDNFHVQGFAGSYLLSVGFQAVTTVVGVVLTAINPIIGLAVSAVGSAVSALIGMIPDKKDTQVTEDDARNNLYAQPVFQGWINSSDVYSYMYGTPVNDSNLWNVLYNKKCVTVRIPGWSVSLYYDDATSKIQYEFFISADWVKYTMGVTIYGPDNTSTPWKTPRPYARFHYNYLNTTSMLDRCPGEVHAKYMMHRVRLNMGAGSYASFTELVNKNRGSENPYSVDDCANWTSDCVNANIGLALYYMTLGMAIYEGHAGDAITRQSPSVPNAGATTLEWVQYWHRCLTVYGTSSTSITWWGFNSDGWSNTVNKVIPRYRSTFENSDVPICGLCKLIRMYHDMESDYEGYKSPTLVTQGIACTTRYHWVPPKYSKGARAMTIAIAATAAVVTVAALVVKAQVKKKVQKKMIKRYRDVQQNWNDYMASGSDADLDKYYKSIRSYNRWSGICGTSKLSMISGWETGDSSKSSATLPSFNKTSQDISNLKQTNNVETPSVDIMSIVKLIKGSY